MGAIDKVLVCRKNLFLSPSADAYGTSPVPKASTDQLTNESVYLICKEKELSRILFEKD